MRPLIARDKASVDPLKLLPMEQDGQWSPSDLKSGGHQVLGQLGTSEWMPSEDRNKFCYSRHVQWLECWKLDVKDEVNS